MVGAHGSPARTSVKGEGCSRSPTVNSEVVIKLYRHFRLVAFKLGYVHFIPTIFVVRVWCPNKITGSLTKIVHSGQCSFLLPWLLALCLMTIQILLAA